MKLKTLLAPTVIAGVATVGTGATAFAQTTQPTNPTTTARRDHDFCQRWVPRLPSLDARRIQDEQKIDDLQQAIAVAKDHHREDLVERLEHQLDQVQRDHTGLVALIAVIHLRCG
jgi:hypothetical protein